MLSVAAPHARALRFPPGIAAIDVPHFVLDDATTLRQDAARVKALGFTGKVAVQPKQIASIVEAFTPTPAEIAHPQAVVDALAAAGGHAVEHQGKMEGPIVKAAERVPARARR